MARLAQTLYICGGLRVNGMLRVYKTLYNLMQPVTLFAIRHIRRELESLCAFFRGAEHSAFYKITRGARDFLCREIARSGGFYPTLCRAWWSNVGDPSTRDVGVPERERYHARLAPRDAAERLGYELDVGTVGSATQKTLPRGSLGTTPTSPSMASTRCLTMASPSPVPPISRERPGSTR